MEYLTPQIIQGFRFARFAKSGAWPVAGGTLDQSRWFLDFCASLWADQAAFKAERESRVFG